MGGWRWFVVVLWGVLVAGCGGAAPAAPTATPPVAAQVASETAIVRSTLTATATVTNTPQPPAATPTLIRTPTVTPTPLPGSRVLIQYGMAGGDGSGGSLDAHLGGGTPWFVLYADGTLIIREGEHGQRYFLSTKMTDDEVCHLLASIAATGVFELDYDDPTPYDSIIDSFYEFELTPFPPMGAGYVAIQLNGQLAANIPIYRPYLGSVVEEIRAVLDILDSYRPAGLMPYQGEALAIQILTYAALIKDQPVYPWPDDLPPLIDLIGKDVHRRSVETTITGDLIPRIYQLFDNVIRSQVFVDDGREYFITVRPMLPHEIAQQRLGASFPVHEYVLPFDCDE